MERSLGDHIIVGLKDYWILAHYPPQSESGGDIINT